MIHEQDTDAVVTSTLARGDARGLVILRYDTEDPYAMHLVFPGNDPWRFSRDIVADALAIPGNKGIGDVQVRDDTETGKVIFFLSSPEGLAAVKIPREDVAEFIGETFEMVPGGDEDSIANDAVDRLLADILPMPGE